MVISFSGLGVIRAVSWWEHDEPNSSTFRSRGCFLGVQLSNMIALVSDTPDDRENVTLSYLPRHVDLNFGLRFPTAMSCLAMVPQSKLPTE